MSIESYINLLSISGRLAGRVEAKSSPITPALPEQLDAAVDVGSILSFVSSLQAREKSDVLFSVQLAQRAADDAFDRVAQTRAWYGKYGEVLEAVGWTMEQFAFAAHTQAEGDFVMDKAALGVIAAIASGNQLGVITASIAALERLGADDKAVTLFDTHGGAEGAGNFQIGAVQKDGTGTLSMALGAFYFRAIAQRRGFLFFKWGTNDVNFWTAAQKMTLNLGIYDKVRRAVEHKLGNNALDFIARLDIR